MSKEQKLVTSYIKNIGYERFAAEAARNTLPKSISLAMEIINACFPLPSYSTTSFGEQS